MKKIFIILASASFLISCKKEFDDFTFDKNASERIEIVNSAFLNELTKAEYGWKATLFPANEEIGGYNFWMSFNDSNRVTMTSEFGNYTTPKSSSFIIKKLQEPSLVFDTYNYIHLLSDPTPSVNAGDQGKGLYSDFEFYIDSTFISAASENTTLPDTLYLRGRYNSSKFVLIKASADDKLNFIPNIIAVKQSLYSLLKLKTYFKRFSYDNNLADISIDSISKILTLKSYTDNGESLSSSAKYNFNSDKSISFLDSLIIGNYNFTSFNAIAFNTQTEILNFNFNNISGTVSGSGQPIKVDLDASKNFYANPPGQAWSATQGVTMEGVGNALPVSGYAMRFFPKGSVGGIDYDLLGFVSGNSINFGPAFNHSFTTDGKIKFTYVGMLGTVPSTVSANVTLIRQLLSDTGGFYAIQTGAKTCDLVKASDGKAWIPFN